MEDKDPKWIKDADESLNPTLPEANASANIKVWIDGYGVMFTTRHKEMSEVVNRIKFLIATAKKEGWKHTWKDEAAEKDTKMCPTHNVEMTAREGKYGKFYSHRQGEGWCNGK